MMAVQERIHAGVRIGWRNGEEARVLARLGNEFVDIEPELVWIPLLVFLDLDAIERNALYPELGIRSNHALAPPAIQGTRSEFPV